MIFLKGSSMLVQCYPLSKFCMQIDMDASTGNKFLYRVNTA